MIARLGARASQKDEQAKMSGSGLVALQSADSIDHKGAPTGPVALGSGRSSGSYSGAVAVRSGDAMGVAGNVSVVAGTASAGGGLALREAAPRSAATIQGRRGGIRRRRSG